MAPDRDAVVFSSDIDAVQPQINDAVALLFGAKVKAVKAIVISGKLKFFHGHNCKGNDVRKAGGMFKEGILSSCQSGFKCLNTCQYGRVRFNGAPLFEWVTKLSTRGIYDVI